MLKHIKKFIPWQTGKEKRQEFLNKLKGASTFQVRENVPTGAMFMLSNKSTGTIDSYVCVGDDRWVCWGMSTGTRNGLSDVFTCRQLEIHLTRLEREVTKKNSIHITDEGNYITRVKPS